MLNPLITYREIVPDLRLKEFIKTYWHFRISTTTRWDFDIIPDGYFDLLISFKNGQIDNIFITGIWDKLITINYTEDTEVIAVRFHPIALNSLCDFNIGNILNRTASMELNDFGLNKQKITDLFNSSREELIRYFDNHFLRLIEQIKINEKLKTAFDIIEKTAGTEQILNISDTLGYSPRHIHRLFNSLLGLSAKDYSRIVRFRKMLPFLKEHKSFLSLYYYDQSHFLREFKKITGKTPQNLHFFEDVRFVQYFKQ